MKVSNVTTRRRLFAALLLLTVLFAALLIRLGYIQLWKGSELAERAEDSWRRNIPVTAKRGEILDRNGIRLAYNISSPSVMAIPAQVQNPAETAAALARVLGADESVILKQLTKDEYIVKLQPAGRKLSREKALEVIALKLPGIVVAEDNRRYYPFGSLASHVLGFTGIDNQGLTGVELYYDHLLSGVRGSVTSLTDAKGRAIPHTSDEYVPPKDGMHLQLTIDKQIQSIVERELEQAMIQHEPNQVLAIAMDPNTGEVLAMASKPDYEPDKYREVPQEIYNRNLPIWMTYEPGSTFKIITLAAALNEGKVDLQHDRFFDPGYIEVGGAKLRCWKRGGHGSQTFLEGVENSCNPGFVMIGQRLGKDLLFEYIRNFGFGAKTGIDLRGEENGILFKPERVGPVELATTAFGQGVSVTPIQQITAVSAAINGGRLMWPHVAKAWIDPDTGKVVETVEPKVVRQVIREDVSAMVRTALESVVANGTGRNAYIDGYRVGGKTGTAQKVVNGAYSASEHIVSFIGFAPADDPKIIVYVAVDNPKGIQFGGLIAAPIVKNILADALRYMGVEPRKNQQPKKLNYGDVPYVEVPNLIGRTLTDIYQDYSQNFVLARSGAGTVVVDQAPKAGVRVPKGSTIRLYLSNEPASTGREKRN